MSKLGGLFAAAVAAVGIGFAQPADAKWGLSGPSAGTLTDREHRGVKPKAVDPSTLEDDAKIPEHLKDEETLDACKPASGMNIPRPPGMPNPCAE